MLDPEKAADPKARLATMSEKQPAYWKAPMVGLAIGGEVGLLVAEAMVAVGEEPAVIFWP